MKDIKWQKYTAEGMASAVLTFGVLVSVNSAVPSFTPIIAALTVGLFVYTIACVSGAQINPAVSVALWSIGKMNRNEMLRYVGAQLVGALVALALYVMFLGQPVPLPVDNSLPEVFGEMFGAFIFVFGFCAWANRKVDDAASGLVVGGSLLLGLTVASMFSNALINPAVAIGVRSISLTYLAAPLVGGAAAAWLYRWFLK